MRGVYSAASITPLLEYGFANVFEHVIGSSAGAINGAYFLSTDVETFHTYTDDLTNKNFVNLLRTDKKVDIDYLVDIVMKHKRPINIQKLLHANGELHIVLTDARTGKAVVISDHQQFLEIYEEFRATAALPILYDRPVKVGGKWFIDGGVSDLLPIDVALKLGCTDILVVMTKPLADYHFDKRRQRLVKHLVHRYASDQPASFRQILPTNERTLKLNLHYISHPLKKFRLYALEPSDSESLVGLATINKKKVSELAQLGITDMDNFLNNELIN